MHIVVWNSRCMLTIKAVAIHGVFRAVPNAAYSEWFSAAFSAELKMPLFISE